MASKGTSAAEWSARSKKRVLLPLFFEGGASAAAADKKGSGCGGSYGTLLKVSRPLCTETLLEAPACRFRAVAALRGSSAAQAPGSEIGVLGCGGGASCGVRIPSSADLGRGGTWMGRDMDGTCTGREWTGRARQGGYE